jgi:hypothetical protein
MLGKSRMQLQLASIAVLAHHSFAASGCTCVKVQLNGDVNMQIACSATAGSFVIMCLLLF